MVHLMDQNGTKKVLHTLYGLQRNVMVPQNDIILCHGSHRKLIFFTFSEPFTSHWLNQETSPFN